MVVADGSVERIGVDLAVPAHVHQPLIEAAVLDLRTYLR